MGGSDKARYAFIHFIIQVLVWVVILLPGWKLLGGGFMATESSHFLGARD